MASFEEIVEVAVDALKARVLEIAKKFEASGLSPRSLSEFERELHSSLGELGRAAEKALLERADVERDVIEHGGLRHYWKYKGPQEYECLFGKIEVERSVYQANGERTLCPLEVNAGIVYHHLTPAAAEFVGYATAYMVPAEVEQFCRKWQYLKPCQTVVKQVAAEIGDVAETLGETYEQAVREEEGPVPAETEVIAVSRDRTSLRTREDGWRQAEVGAVAVYGPVTGVEEDGDLIRPRLRTTYVAQMPEQAAATFKRKFDGEVEHALEAAPSGARVVCLSDGDRSNWKYFESHPRLRHGTQVLDFYHAASHLKEVSEALFGEGTAQAERWFTKYRRVLKYEDGGVEKVIRSIRYHKSRLPIRSEARRKVTREVLRYFAHNRKRMDYAAYRLRGLPIGSGVVEAACKTVVGQRFKRPGMRWSIPGGQAILNLRVATLSERWEAFWRYHENILAIDKVAA